MTYNAGKCGSILISGGNTLKNFMDRKRKYQLESDLSSHVYSSKVTTERTQSVHEASIQLSYKKLYLTQPGLVQLYLYFWRAYNFASNNCQIVRSAPSGRCISSIKFIKFKTAGLYRLYCLLHALKATALPLMS